MGGLFAISSLSLRFIEGIRHACDGVRIKFAHDGIERDGGRRQGLITQVERRSMRRSFHCKCPLAVTIRAA